MIVDKEGKMFEDRRKENKKVDKDRREEIQPTRKSSKKTKK